MKILQQKWRAMFALLVTFAITFVGNVEAAVNPDNSIFKIVDDNTVIGFKPEYNGQYSTIRIYAPITRVYKFAFSGDIDEDLYELRIEENNPNLGSLIEQIESIKELIIDDSVTVLEHDSFSDCPNLGRVVIGNGLKFHEDEGQDGIRYNAFSWCPNIRFEVKEGSSYSVFSNMLMNAAQTCVRFGENADVTSDGTVIFPSTLKTIAADSFTLESGSKIKRVNIPDNVSVGEWAFDDMSALEHLTIGNNVTLEFMAFANCAKLKTVTFTGAPPKLDMSARTPDNVDEEEYDCPVFGRIAWNSSGASILDSTATGYYFEDNKRAWGKAIVDGKWQGLRMVLRTVVATIGEEEYDSLEEAFAAGDEVVLVARSTAETTVTGNKTIDMNGNTIATITVADGAELTLTGKGIVNKFVCEGTGKIKKGADVLITPPQGFQWGADGYLYEPVAMAGGVYFATLQDAADIGGSIIVLKDVDLGGDTLTITTNAIFDLSTKGDKTIKNGQIDITGGKVSFVGGAGVLIDENDAMTIEDEANVSFESGVNFQGGLTLLGNAELTVDNDSSIFVPNGSEKEIVLWDSATLNLYGSIQNARTGDDVAGIEIAPGSYCVLNILEGGSIVAPIGVNAEGGEVVLNGGEIIGSKIGIKLLEGTFVSGKVSGEEAALYELRDTGTGQPLNKTIKDGEFRGDISGFDNRALKVTGGKFTVDVSSYIDANYYQCTLDSENFYVVTLKDGVSAPVEVDDTPYADVDDAFDALNSSDQQSLTLGGDVSGNQTVNSNRNTLDMDGHTLDGTLTANAQYIAISDAGGITGGVVTGDSAYIVLIGENHIGSANAPAGIMSGDLTLYMLLGSSLHLEGSAAALISRSLNIICEDTRITTDDLIMSDGNGNPVYLDGGFFVTTPPTTTPTNSPSPMLHSMAVPSSEASDIPSNVAKTVVIESPLELFDVKLDWSPAAWVGTGTYPGRLEVTLKDGVKASDITKMNFTFTDRTDATGTNLVAQLFNSPSKSAAKELRKTEEGEIVRYTSLDPARLAETGKATYGMKDWGHQPGTEEGDFDLELFMPKRDYPMSEDYIESLLCSLEITYKGVEKTLWFVSEGGSFDLQVTSPNFTNSGNLSISKLNMANALNVSPSLDAEPNTLTITEFNVDGDKVYGRFGLTALMNGREVEVSKLGRNAKVKLFGAKALNEAFVEINDAIINLEELTFEANVPNGVQFFKATFEVENVMN